MPAPHVESVEIGKPGFAEVAGELAVEPGFAAEGELPAEEEGELPVEDDAEPAGTTAPRFAQSTVVGEVTQQSPSPNWHPAAHQGSPMPQKPVRLQQKPSLHLVPAPQPPPSTPPTGSDVHAGVTVYPAGTCLAFNGDAEIGETARERKVRAAQTSSADALAALPFTGSRPAMSAICLYISKIKYSVGLVGPPLSDGTVMTVKKSDPAKNQA